MTLSRVDSNRGGGTRDPLRHPRESLLIEFHLTPSTQMSPLFACGGVKLIDHCQTAKNAPTAGGDDNPGARSRGPIVYLS